MLNHRDEIIGTSSNQIPAQSSDENIKTDTTNENISWVQTWQIISKALDEVRVERNTKKIEELRKASVENRIALCIKLDNKNNTILHYLVKNYSNEQQRNDIERQLKEVLNILVIADQVNLLKTCNSMGETALHLAVREKHVNLIKLMIAELRPSDRDEVLLIQDANRYTILHLAALSCPELLSDLYLLYSPQNRYKALTGSTRSLFAILPENIFTEEMSKIYIAFNKIYTAFKSSHQNNLPDLTPLFFSIDNIKIKLNKIEKIANTNIKKIFELSIRHYENCNSDNRKLFYRIWLELNYVTDPVSTVQIAAITNALDLRNLSAEEAEIECISNICGIEISALNFNSIDIQSSEIMQVRHNVLDLFDQRKSSEDTLTIEKRKKFNELDVLICRRILSFYVSYNRQNKNRIENKTKLLNTCKSAYEECLSNFKIVNIDEIISSLENECKNIINNANYNHKKQITSKLMRTQSRFSMRLQNAISYGDNSNNKRHSKFVIARERFDIKILDKLPAMKPEERIELCKQQDFLGNTVLHEFVLKDNKLQDKVIALLTLLDAKNILKLIKMQNAKGYTVLHLAVTENPDLISQIISLVPENERDSVLNIQTTTGNTILHLALLLNQNSFESLLMLYSAGARYDAMNIKDTEGFSVASYLRSDLKFDYAAKIVTIFPAIFHSIYENINAYHFYPKTNNLQTNNEKLKIFHGAKGWHGHRALHLAYKHAENYNLNNEILIIDLYISREIFYKNFSLPISHERFQKIIKNVAGPGLNSDEISISDSVYAETILQIKFIKLRKQFDFDQSLWEDRKCVIDLLKDNELRNAFRVLDAFIFDILRIYFTYDHKNNQNRKDSLAILLVNVKYTYEICKNNPSLSIEKIDSIKKDLFEKCQTIAQEIEQDHREHGKLAAVGTESELARLILRALAKTSGELNQPDIKRSKSSFKRLSFLGSYQRPELPEHMINQDASDNNNDKTDVDRFNELIQKLTFKNKKINTIFKEELSKKEDIDIQESIINQVKSQNRLSQQFQKIKMFNSLDSSFKMNVIQSLVNFIKETETSLRSPNENHNFEVAIEDLNKHLQTMILRLRDKSPRKYSSTANDLEDFINNYIVPELKHKTIAHPVSKPKRSPIESPTMQL